MPRSRLVWFAALAWFLLMQSFIIFWGSIWRVQESEISYAPKPSVVYCSSKYGYYSCSPVSYVGGIIRKTPIYLVSALLTPLSAYETISCWEKCNAGLQETKPILLTTPYLFIPLFYLILVKSERTKSRLDETIAC